MPQEIYNEGRVVGFSAWELFKRQALGNGVPENEIPNEREWISSMIGCGASMILKVPGSSSASTAGVHDFELPFNSNLSAAGVIVATPFIGDCVWDDTGRWATKVSSYGPLILNDDEHSPERGGNPEVPSNTDYTNYKNSLTEFMRISDGIVYTQNANWLLSGTYSEEFEGNGSQASFVLNKAAVSIISVLIGQLPATYEFDDQNNAIVFSTAPGQGTRIDVKYYIHGAPEKDIDPNFNNSSTIVRLYFNSDIIYDVNILLTGFTNKRILQGISGYAVDGGEGPVGGSTDTENNNWSNGGMLGPEIIPWASKIVFSVPSYAYTLVNELIRTVPSDATYTIPKDGLDIAGIRIKESAIDGKVKVNSVIDIDSINLTDYYTNANHTFTSSPTLKEDISSATLGTSNNYGQVVAWYPGMSAAKIQKEAEAATPSNANFFPPALYAASVKDTGEAILVPLDTAAPGTVKGFKTADEAHNYKMLMPDNYSVYNPDNNTFSFAIYENESHPENWPGLAKLRYLTNSDYPEAELTAGPVKANLIALTDPTTNTDYVMDGTSGMVPVGPDDNLNWDQLLRGLKNNYGVDVLGPRLHALGHELTGSGQTHTIGIGTGNNDISEIASAKVTVTGSYPVSATTTQHDDGTVHDTTTNLLTLDQNSSVKVGTNFIEFGNGLRLYISNSEPDTANVPEGSIGIGWEASNSSNANSNNDVVTDTAIEHGGTDEEHHVSPMY